MDTKSQAAWFIFGRSIWPTFDTYCDISISIYCILSADVWAWGLAMLVPLLYHLACSISSYVRMRKRNMLEKNDMTWIAIPFFIWPQLQAGKIGKAMWNDEEDWKTKKEQHESYESRSESSIEGIMQSIIVSFIILRKYVEKEEYLIDNDCDYDFDDYSYNCEDVDDTFGTPISGIVGTYQILSKWPLRMELGTGVGNKILLAAVVIFGMFSRFGALGMAFVVWLLADLQEEDMAGKIIESIILAVIFCGFQLVLCLIPLQGFGPGRFWNVFLSFPHIHIMPLITPFTFGLVCDEKCVCHCCSCCGCSKPRLALSKNLTLANFIVTLLLMIPPIAFFWALGSLELPYWTIISWFMVASQLFIMALGVIAIPLLLYQPGRIVKLGVLDPDNIGRHLISTIKGGGRMFRLTTAKPVQKLTTAEPVQDMTTADPVQAEPVQDVEQDVTVV